MNITHIRNATQLITYAGKRFLIDPMLAAKDAYPGFPGTARAEDFTEVAVPMDLEAGQIARVTLTGHDGKRAQGAPALAAA